MNRIVVAAAAAAVALGAATGASAQTKIVFNSFAPPKFVINQGMIDAWAKNVEKATQGRVKVELVTGLAPPQQQWEMVTQGVADGAYIFNAFARKRLLLPQIAHLPFVTPTATAQAVALWRIHKETFEKANEHKGVAFLGYFGSPAAQIASLDADKPFVAVGDLKDVKTWSLPGDQARALAKLGAVIVPGPAVRSYEIISKGIVNAYGGQNCDSSYSFNIAQFAKSMTFIPGGMGSAAFSVFLNQQKWDSIPKKDQEAIMGVSGEALAKLSEVWDAREVKSCERMRAEGKIKVIKASDELVAALKREWAFLADEWVENANSRHIDGRAALVRYEQLTEQLAK